MKSYTINQIKDLPCMQMEKMGVCNQYGMGCCDGRNVLREQVLSELTSKPTLNKSKDGRRMLKDIEKKYGIDFGEKDSMTLAGLLKKRGLSSLAKLIEGEPTVTKPKTGKGDVTRCNTDITKPKDRLKELKKDYDFLTKTTDETLLLGVIWGFIAYNFKPKESQ